MGRKQFQWTPNLNMLDQDRGILSGAVTRPEPGEYIPSELWDNLSVVENLGEGMSIDPQSQGFSQENFEFPFPGGFARQNPPKSAKSNPNPRNQGILITK
ncbi:hypothetical protein U1Q18_022083 [Sarracenia purpurea var. burkii]